MDIKELNEKRLLKKMSYEDIAEFTGIKQEDVKAILLEQTRDYWQWNRLFYQEIECRLLIMQLNTDL